VKELDSPKGAHNLANWSNLHWMDEKDYRR